MDHLKHNRAAWNREATGGGPWSSPVDAATIEAARRGDWSVILTPRKAVPRAWLGDLAGRDVLCLASAGGQQVPIFAAAGARVTSFDLSDAQLELDRAACERAGLVVRCVQGDMADLSRFDDGAFDLVFHPASNVFVPDLRPVWRGCHRVLRPGGHLLAGFMSPVLFMFDHDEAEQTGELVVRYPLPYTDVDSLPAERLRQRIERGEPLEYSHSLDAQIGGPIDAGFAITGFYEDGWLDETWLISRYAPVAAATRAQRAGAG